MGLHKGNTNNPSGRPRGKPNRSTEELRKVLHSFIDENIEKLQADFDSLEPKDRLNYLEKLLAHVLPKPITSLDQLSESDLDILLERLKNQSNEQQENQN